MKAVRLSMIIINIAI